MSTPPDSITAHSHITEREAGAWDDCAWCSAVMFTRLAFDSSIPATHAEAKALRAAANEPSTGGSNSDDLLRGLKARYNFTPAVVYGYDNLLAYLSKPGRVAVAMGSMGAFPAGSSIRRWDPGFAGGHATFVARCDGNLRVWWDDPLAPQDGTYQGQWLSSDDLAKFVRALGNVKLVVGEVQGDIMAIKEITSEVPATMTVNPGTVFFALDGVTKLSTFGGTTALVDRLSPFAAGTQRAMYANIGGVRQTVLVTPVAGSVKDIVDTSPYTQAQIDAARTAATASGVSTEKSRLRNLLGL